MSDPDACALRPDGTLKDASEIEWLHSPTTDHIPLPPTNTLHDDIANEIFEGDDLPEPQHAPPRGFKGKEPARRVAGRRIPKPSGKVSASSEQNLDPGMKKFFSSRFEGILIFPSLFIYCTYVFIVGADEPSHSATTASSLSSRSGKQAIFFPVRCRSTIDFILSPSRGFSAVDIHPADAVECISTLPRRKIALSTWQGTLNLVHF